MTADPRSREGDARDCTFPRGATDCHVHVLDPTRFAFADDATYKPVASEWGTAEDLAATLDASGIERVVLVNPTSGYGTDNQCMLDALERLGTRARGIARVSLDVGGRQLDALARRGVVGVRLDFVASGLDPLDDPALAKLLACLADRDLVCDVQAEGEQWTAIAPRLASVPVRVVIDHLGRPDPARGVEAPGFDAVLRLAENERTAVKLSGPMRYSRQRRPYADVDPFIDAAIRAFTPRALVWGSDWPFLRAEGRYDYAPMLAVLSRWIAAARDLEDILAHTPARWFGFAPR